MKLRKLAEAIILQSIEDLYDARHIDGSIDFFTGEGFHICARLAGLGSSERLRILKLVHKIVGFKNKKQARLRTPATISPSALATQKEAVSFR